MQTVVNHAGKSRFNFVNTERLNMKYSHFINSDIEGAVIN